MVRAIREREPLARIVGLDDNWTSSDLGDHGGALSGRVRQSLQDTDAGGFKNYQFDLVVHLASPASPLRYQADPLRTSVGNAIGAIRCVEWCKPDGVIFTTSTSEVYGDPIVSPQPESYKGQVDCTGPRACYDESKRFTESLFFDAYRTRRVASVRIARLFNVYGPGTLPDDGRAVSNFITQALRGEAITVYGTGQQKRSFTYIDDVVEGLMRMIYDCSYIGPLNIGMDREETVLNIAHCVREQVRLRDADMYSEIVHLAAAVDDPQQRRPDLTLARKLIGWNPRVSYEEGISRTIDYFKEELGL
jgi:nucleoside-diphosphate-sugar epimerase